MFQIVLFLPQLLNEKVIKWHHRSTLSCSALFQIVGRHIPGVTKSISKLPSSIESLSTGRLKFNN